MKKVSIFDKIDNYYDKQPNTNVFYMSILLCALVIGYLIYDYTYDSTKEELESSKTELQKANDKLNEINTFIERHNLQGTIKNLNLRLQRVKEDKEKVIAENNYFDEKLREASKLLYNEKNWSEFMVKINELSKKYNINLYDVKSNINDINSQNVEEVFNIVFVLDGKFQDILHFVNKLEQAVDVVDVAFLSIYKEGINEENKNITNNSIYFDNEKKTTSTNKNKIKADIKISIWGIKY